MAGIHVCKFQVCVYSTRTQYAHIQDSGWHPPYSKSSSYATEMSLCTLHTSVCPVVDIKISVGGSSCEIEEGQGQWVHSHSHTILS